jgi:aarF domain-containing kinase
VLLDHGLYKELDRDFRLDYCRLWKAIALAEVPAIREMCIKLGAGDMYPLLAAMLTARPWDDIVSPDLDSLTPRGNGGVVKGGREAGEAGEAGEGAGAAGADDADEDQAKIGGYVQKYAQHIGEILNRVPRQMLLLFKTNDCLRHSDRMLGCPVNTFLTTARMCVRALAVEEQRAKPGWRSWMRGLLARLRVELQIVLFYAAKNAADLKRAVAAR